MEQDIYTITPELEAKLTHAIALLDDYLDDGMIIGHDADERVAEACAILEELPFFKKSY